MASINFTPVLIAKKFKFLLALTAMGLGLFLAAQALATTLEVPLPGMPANVSDPGVYIRYLFIFGLSAVGFLAVGGVVIGGIQYMLSGTLSSTEKARKTIISSLGGVFLLLCSWLLLSTIDPTLTNLSPMPLTPITLSGTYKALGDIELPPHEGLSYSDDQVKSSGIAKGNYANTINAMAQKYNVPPNLIKAIIMAESGGYPNATGPQTKYGQACGLMQLMTTIHKINDCRDPAQNIEAGTKYLSSLLKLHKNDAQKAIASYNWGQGNLSKKCNNQIDCANIPRETKIYLKRVNRFWRDFNGQG